jgi:hypothetical protein
VNVVSATNMSSTTDVFAGCSGAHLLRLLPVGYGLLKCQQLWSTLNSLCRRTAHSKLRVDMCSLGESPEDQVLKERGKASGWQQSRENPSRRVVEGPQA